MGAQWGRRVQKDDLNSRLRFGDFELSLATGELRKAGRRIRLRPQSCKVLALLLERPGELVTRDELRQKLWGEDTFVDFEHGLNFAVRKLRESLGDDADQPRYIETLPRLGYRFVGRLEGSLQDADAAATEAVRTSESSESVALPATKGGSLLRWRLLALVTVALLAVISGLLWLMSLSPQLPKVLRSVQLTHLGRIEPASRVLTDGTRLYVTARTGGRWYIAQVPPEGGEPSAVPTLLSNVVLNDIHPAGTKLLVSLQVPGPAGPLWVLPAGGGSARRLGEVVAEDAAWSPDGRWIVYIHEAALYIVGEDGDGPQRLVGAQGNILCPRWAPDGRLIAFTVEDSTTGARSLWEVGSDGRNPHPVSLSWATAPPAPAAWGEGECCEVWSPDSRYVVFRSNHRGISSLWALPVKPGRGGRRVPVQLYTSPDQIGPPEFSRNGKQLLFANYHPSRELVRYDRNQRKFLPYLLGIPARFVSVSHDGRWVAYRSEADGTLWRSRADGTERLQLTFPPMDPYQSTWSPDGERIVFDGSLPGKSANLYVIASRGGPVEEILGNAVQGYASEPGWSPDGRLLVFDNPGPPAGLYLFDLSSRTVHRVEGSEGLAGARWSPNGLYLAAVGANSTRLMLFELSAQRWSELAAAESVYIEGVRWSPDSRYVYYQDVYLGEEQPVFRVRIADRKIEKIISYQMIERADVTGYSLTGLAPDGSPLASLIHSNSDIYALDLDLP